MSILKGATVLVTGATGAVGPSVVQALCEAGHVIRSFSTGQAAQRTTDDGRRTPDDGRQTTDRRRGTTAKGWRMDDERWPSNVETRIGYVPDPSTVQSAM